ncbi:MAG TPA: DUF420 domain-containing protein [Nitrospiria bacterium]
MKELFRQPGFLPAHGTFGADLSFIMALLFTTLFLIGWRMGRRKQGNQHHTLVLWAMVSMLVYFTVYYLAQGLGALATEGREGFGGPEGIYEYIFKPLLTVHILAVSLGLILAFYMIILGFRVTLKESGQRVLRAGPLKITWAGLMKTTAGVLIFFVLVGFLRCDTMRCAKVYIYGFLIFLTFAVVLEKGIEKLFPDGEKRHRLMGTFTMVLYAIALITSSATYLMLYVIWPPAPHG